MANQSRAIIQDTPSRPLLHPPRHQPKIRIRTKMMTIMRPLMMRLTEIMKRRHSLPILSNQNTVMGSQLRLAQKIKMRSRMLRKPKGDAAPRKAKITRYSEARMQARDLQWLTTCSERNCGYVVEWIGLGNAKAYASAARPQAACVNE